MIEKMIGDYLSKPENVMRLLHAIAKHVFHINVLADGDRTCSMLAFAVNAEEAYNMAAWSVSEHPDEFGIKAGEKVYILLSGPITKKEPN